MHTKLFLYIKLNHKITIDYFCIEQKYIDKLFRHIQIICTIIKSHLSLKILNKEVIYFSYSFWNTFKRRVLHISIGKMHYLRLEIDINNVKKQLERFDLPVKELMYDDFLKGNKDVFKGNKLAFIKKRLKDPNYKAYGIIEDDYLVYSTWISLDKLGLSVDTKYIKMNPEEGLLEDSYCDPKARGRGLHGIMNFWRINKLYELGKRKVLAMVLDGNTPAMKVQIKSGFKEVGTFYNGYFMGFKVNTLNKKKFDNTPTKY